MRRLAVAAGVAVTLIGFSSGLPALAQTDGDTSSVDAISAAGNSEDEQERYRLLVELAGRLPPDDALRADLDRLIPVIDQWANGREKYWVPGDQDIGEDGYLAGFFNFQVHPAEPGAAGYPPEIAADSPLYPIWAMYRGRMLIQQAIQTGFIQRDPATRESYMGDGRELLEVAAAAFPQNRILGMWLDDPIAWPAAHRPDPKAPEWANLQRHALEKLADIIDFWIDERQAPDGQFGGGWGDDVEMWRLWTPILVGFSDEHVEEAERLLATGLWELPRVAGGYTSTLTDVEHSGEDTGDTVTAMLHVDPDDPVWAGRAERLADLMRDTWAGRNERDQLQFKSVYFTADEASADPAFACDTPYNTRAVQPALLLWQRTRGPELTALFTDWLDTWVEASKVAERGKPAGVIPAAIGWPSGETGGPEPDWWNPGCAITIDQGLYEWPSFVSPKLRSLVLAFWITGNDRYLEPLLSLAELRREQLSSPTTEPEPGTAAWAAAEIGGELTDPLAKYRLLTGDDSFDDLLIADADPYMTYRLTGDDGALIESLEELVAAFSTNQAAYTTEVRWTDRLFSFNPEYANHYVDPPMPVASPDILYNMVTGDAGDAQYLPLNAVRWQTAPRDLAVRVDSHDPTSLSARLYHFGAADRPMGAELLVLEPDTYDWRVDCDGTEAGAGSLDANDDAPVLEFTLPARVECLLAVGPDLVDSVDAPATTDPAQATLSDGSAAAQAREFAEETGGGRLIALLVALVAVVAVVAVGAVVLRSRRTARRGD